ncbi:MAG: hypothetical protein ACON4X_06040 [Polaribacter sp.]
MSAKEGDFKAQLDLQKKVNYKEVLEVLGNQNYSIADARSESRFYGRTP